MTKDEIRQALTKNWAAIGRVEAQLARLAARRLKLRQELKPTGNKFEPGMICQVVANRGSVVIGHIDGWAVKWRATTISQGDDILHMISLEIEIGDEFTLCSEHDEFVDSEHNVFIVNDIGVWE